MMLFSSYYSVKNSHCAYQDVCFLFRSKTEGLICAACNILAAPILGLQTMIAAWTACMVPASCWKSSEGSASFVASSFASQVS